MEENNYTMEQMRADYQALKESIDKQEIINDRLMRETMRSRVSTIRNKTMVSVMCGVFVMLFAPFIFHYNPVIRASWWFIGGTEILMVISLFFSWKFNHKVQRTDLSSCNLLEFCKDVKKMKADYIGWIKWGLLLSFAWGGWLFGEVWAHSEEPKLAIFMLCGLGFGMILGLIIGLRILNKVIGTCEDIIFSIEDN